ncbi:MAG: lysine--tRNA ligase [Candidatus Nanoarchaeia archaeon]|jgi:lysyl-tRNA synthetase class 1|nr:lysine--tRNA ligase [Candidatus Nanoarchaeia archaeon]|tara:strand:- start:29663 stop:31213 length:1551 start_codon:yes stop_codon:yes gene_type:complete
MGNSHWAYKIADRLAMKHRGSKIVCASGISPSGPIHIGNLREVMTTELVYRALQQKGIDSEFIFSWDDFDKFRKIPIGSPKSLENSIGKPYSSIDDPFGEYESYAERFEVKFEESLSQLGINPRFIRQTEMYKSGEYDLQIKEILNKRSQIAEILARNMTQGMTEEQKKNYFPIVLYSRFTGKDNTKVLSYDGDSKLTYLCHDSGKKDTIDFTKDRVIKLPWKIDWPMRWVFESVNFEPGGADHASPGSSYDVSSQIVKEIFENSPPHFQEYQFVRIKGQAGKMSSSSGNVITPGELLNVYPPELIKFLYARCSPTAPLDIALDKDVIRAFAEFDSDVEGWEEGFRKLITEKTKSELSRSIPFRKIFGLGEATGYNLEIIKDLLRSEGGEFSDFSIEDRLKKSDYWSRTHFSEGRSELRDSPNTSHLSLMSADAREKIRSLEKKVLSQDGLTLDEIELEIYSIPKREGMSDQEKKIAQRSFFKDVYQLLFGKNNGPRLPTYFWSSKDKDRIRRLLG